MRYHTNRLTCCVMVLILTAITVIQSPATDEKSAPYDAILNYEYGQSRLALSEVEEAVRVAPPAEALIIEQRLIDTLTHYQATDACRQFVCRMLRRNTTTPTEPTWRRLLFFLPSPTPPRVKALAHFIDDPTLSHMALFALQEMPSPAVDKLLRKTLADMTPETEPALLIGIIGAIGQRGDGKAVKLLAPFVESENPDIARAALQALGHIATPKAAKTLERFQVLPMALNQVRLESWLRCADARADKGDLKTAAAMYMHASKDYYPIQIQVAAHRGLAHTGRVDTAQLLVDLLEEEERDLRLLAAKLLSEITDDAAALDFAARLPELSPESQVIGIRGLAARGDRNASLYLISAASSQYSDVRVAAVMGLAEIGGARAVPIFINACSKPDALGQAARTGLYRLSGYGVDKALANALVHPDAQIRAILLDVLTARGITDALPEILDACGDGDARVRETAYKALGALAGDDFYPAMIESILEIPTPTERETMQTALASVVGRLTNQERGLRLLTQAIRRADDAAKVNLIPLLPRFGTQAALNAALSGLSGSDALRTASIRALADWPTPAPMQTLRETAEKETQLTGKVLALRGYVRMIGQSAQNTDERLKGYLEAMSLAPNDGERRGIISLLANVPDSKALESVKRYWDNEALAIDAQSASVRIAVATAGADPKMARDTLNAIIAKPASPAVKVQAQEALNKLDQYRNCVVSWMMAGPFAEDGKDGAALFDIPFAPETSDARDIQWNLVSGAGDQPWMIDFGRLIGGENKVVYLQTRIISDSVQPARLELGSDDGVKAWLNGKLVHANNASRPAELGQDAVDVTLKAGENTLLLKINQGGGNWAACARLRATDGSALEGVTIKP